MGKHDMPSLELIVDRGRLAPSGPYEAEVLDSYANGAVLTVSLRQRRSPPLLKKYWAILRDLVENASTPWQSKEEASDALKLALGVTDIGKTVGGQWFIRPGSISFASMDEAEFRRFFECAMATLTEVTGIDPDTLRARYAHIPEQEPSASPPSPGADDGSGDDRLSSPDVAAADQSRAAGLTEEIGLMQECVAKLLALAVDRDAPEDERGSMIETAEANWRDALPGRERFVKVAAECARRVADGADKAQAEAYLATRIEKERAA